MGDRASACADPGSKCRDLPGREARGGGGTPAVDRGGGSGGTGGGRQAGQKTKEKRREGQDLDRVPCPGQGGGCRAVRTGPGHKE